MSAEDKTLQAMGDEMDEERVEYGAYRENGTSGPEAVYIEKSLERWKLRGDGYLNMK